MLVRLPPRCTQCDRTPHFFQNHEGATPDLVPLPRRSGRRSRLRLIDHERVSSRPIQLKAQPGRLRCELARMRSVTMGAENDHSGVRAAVCPSPSVIRRGDPISGAAGAVSFPPERDRLPALKRSDKYSASRGGSFRLLQPLFPGPQKGRELSANIRSTCVEQSTHAATVQNADTTPACAVYKAKRLVYHDRLKRCIFPRSDPPQTSEISEVCIRRNSIPIQRTPIRPSSGAEGIHKVRRSSHRPITSTRLTRIQLSGRLVNSCSFRGRSGAGRPPSGGAPVSTGLCDKQGKKRSVPQANYAFSRHGSRLHLHGGQAVSSTNECHQDMRAPVPTATVSLVAVLPPPVRNDGVSRHSTPTGDVAYAAIPNMVPVYEAQRSHRQASQSSG